MHRPAHFAADFPQVRQAASVTGACVAGVRAGLEASDFTGDRVTALIHGMDEVSAIVD